MSEYKVIFRVDIDHSDNQHEITWEQGCPLMFEAIQVSRDVESGKAFLQTKVRNLSNTVIPSFEAKLACHYKDGSTEEFKIEPLDADIAPYGEYVIKPIVLSKGDAINAEAFIVLVSIGNKDWKSSTDADPLPKRKLLTLSKEALAERALLLQERGCNKASEAASYSCVEYDSWVQCSCGQASTECFTCPACGLRLSGIQETENSEFLKKSIAKRIVQLKETVEEKKRQEKKTKAKTKKLTIIGVLIAVVVTFVMAYFSWILPNVLQPANSYSEATRLLENQEYNSAYEIFIELEDYNDSRDQAHAAASGLLSKGEYDAAIKAFKNLSEYADSAEKVEEAENGSRFIKASKLASNQNYADAIAMLTSMTKHTTESSALLSEAYGKDAERLFRSGSIRSAVEYIDNMGDKTWETNKIMEEIDSFERKYGKWLGKWCYSDKKKYNDGAGKWVYDQKDIEITITAKYSDGLELCVKSGDGSDTGDKAYELKKINREGKLSYELRIDGEDKLVLADTHTRILTNVGGEQIEETFPGGNYRKTLSKVDSGWY